MFTQKQVEWRDIPGYEGLYQVSDDGRVFSMPRKRTRNNGTVYFLTGKELSQGRGIYPTVGLSKDGMSRPWRVHELVMLAFVGPRPPGLVICHGDDNPSNNNLENLRYDTQRGNMQDVVKRKAQRKPFYKCCAGHLLTPGNVKLWGTGNRICLSCQRGDAPVKELPDSIFR